METLMKQPREVRMILGGTLLYIIFSFFDWQSAFGYGATLWHGVGIVAVLLAIALLAWEIARAVGVNIDLGSVSHGLVSIALAAALLLFTLITFFNWSQARSWPAWLGLILSIVIAVAAGIRARDEGVELPSMPKSTASSSGGASTASAASTTASPGTLGGAAEEPPASTDPASGGS